MPKKTATHNGEKSPAAVRKRHDASPSLHQTEQINPTDALARAVNAPASTLAAADMLTLQRTAGNHAVEQILAQRVHHQQSSRLTIQAKLTVGAADDPYEREADRVAAAIMQTSEPSVPHIQRQPVPEEDEDMVQKKPAASCITPFVQRQEMPEKEDEEQRLIQRSGSSGTASVEPSLERGIGRARTSGQPLPGGLRTRMEKAFVADFSSVRVHADTEADRLNRSLQARAFTTGQDLFFKRGEYNPASRAGQELIAHELTHVIQQNGQRVAGKTSPTEPSDQSGQRRSLSHISSPPKLSRVLTLRHVPASADLIQMMKWPKKGQDEIVELLGESWPAVSKETAKKVYEWCSDDGDFKTLPAAMTEAELSKEIGEYKTSAKFKTANGITDKGSLDGYITFLRKPPAPVALKEYDKSDYKAPSKFLTDQISTLNITIDKMPASYQERLKIADISRESVQSEREQREKTKQLTMDKRISLNATQKEHETTIKTTITEYKNEMAEKERAATAEREWRAAVDGARALAEDHEDFAEVAGNTLAKAAWDASVKYAGKKGFVEANEKADKEADVRTATNALKKFSRGWTRDYKTEQLLKNPHCPGEGKVQDKRGHDAPEARTSQYQADFIATWGKSIMTVHINADEPSK